VAEARQSPLITSGYVDDNSPAASNAGADLTPSMEMLVPQLEDDDEPAEIAPSPRERKAMPDGRFDVPGGDQHAGVDSVSLDDLAEEMTQSAPPQAAPPAEPPYASPHNAAPYSAPIREVSAQDASVYRSPLYPANADEPPRMAPRAPAFESDPVTSVPSLDELIMDGHAASPVDDRGGFFSRLFSKGGKGAEPDNRFGSHAPYEAPVGPPSGAIPMDPTPSWSLPMVPSSERDDAPRSQPFTGEFSVQPEPAPGPGWGSDQRGIRQPEEPGSFAPSAPPRGVDAFSPQSEPAPVVDRYVEDVVEPLDEAPQWTTLPPAFQPEPSRYDEQVTSQYADRAPIASLYEDQQQPSFAQYTQAPHDVRPGGFAPGEPGTLYSPDQLARPMGWETAGASALQAAAPEGATEYRPVVQITPTSGGASEEDFASAVFSELSSLAAERPKVEKTSAGLAKRTPVAREPEPVEPAQVAASAPRDAEAVRSRFSAFYSGTQRARDDVQNFNDSTQGSLTES
jgi:hypothetical protein